MVIGNSVIGYFGRAMVKEDSEEARRDFFLVYIAVIIFNFINFVTGWRAETLNTSL